MSKPAFTPGVLRFEPRYDLDGNIIQYVIVDEHNCIAGVTYSENHARLFCAVSELLGVVAPFIEIWSRGGPSYAERMKTYWGYDNLSAARSALAKALGESSQTAINT